MNLPSSSNLLFGQVFRVPQVFHMAEPDDVAEPEAPQKKKTGSVKSSEPWLRLDASAPVQKRSACHKSMSHCKCPLLVVFL